MFYLSEDKIYALAAYGHGKRYAELEMRMVDGDKTMIVTDRGVDALPPGAFPMTYNECMAVIEPKTYQRRKQKMKGGAPDAADL